MAETALAWSTHQGKKDREHKATAVNSSKDGTRDLLLHERARDLSWRLRLPVVVDDKARDVELVIEVYADGTITPVRVVVGRASRDLMLLDQAAIHGRCLQHKRAVEKLRALFRQVPGPREGLDTSDAADTPLADARAELSALDELVAGRLRTVVEHGRISLAALDQEISFLRSRHALLAPVVHQAAYFAAMRTKGAGRRSLLTR